MFDLEVCGGGEDVVEEIKVDARGRIKENRRMDGC
jgi:hypothetical protein